MMGSAMGAEYRSRPGAGHAPEAWVSDLPLMAAYNDGVMFD